jgi:iron complex transport system substrate-binding protein
MTPPMRGKICSLLPSATEIVFALGLDDRLVGVTHECDFPAAARQLPVVTRTVLGHEVRDSRDIHRHIATALHEGSSLYLLDQSLLERLDPELILTQELCDVCAVSYALVKEAVLRLEGKRQVLSLEPTSLGGILSSIEQVLAVLPSQSACLGSRPSTTRPAETILAYLARQVQEALVASCLHVHV